MLLQRLITTLYETGSHEAVFWSGTTNGVGGTNVAEEIAIAFGGTTLERLVQSRGITLPKWNIHSSVSVHAWVVASMAYAKCASGSMRAVIGNNLRPGNIWEMVEFPALKANPNVIQIVKIDPASGQQTVIFSRPRT